MSPRHGGGCAPPISAPAAILRAPRASLTGSRQSCAGSTLTGCMDRLGAGSTWKAAEAPGQFAPGNAKRPRRRGRGRRQAQAGMAASGGGALDHGGALAILGALAAPFARRRGAPHPTPRGFQNATGVISCARRGLHRPAAREREHAGRPPRVAEGSAEMREDKPKHERTASADARGIQTPPIRERLRKSLGNAVSATDGCRHLSPHPHPSRRPRRLGTNLFRRGERGRGRQA